MGYLGAQSNWYHLVGDTIFGQSPIYYYDWYWDSDSSLSRADSIVGKTTSTGYMRHTTDRPLKVLGIASALTITSFIHDLSEWEGDTTQFYILFDASPSGITEMKRVCWTNDYLTHPIRYMQINSGVRGEESSSSCDNLQLWSEYFTVREYYFDSAITVTDSFYLGKSNYQCSDPIRFITNNLEYYYNLSLYSSVSIENDVTCWKHFPQNTLIQRREETVIDGEQNAWSYHESKIYPLIFLIIEVDTVELARLYSCQVPTNPRTSELGLSATRILWNDATNLRWEVALTNSDGDERIRTTTTTHCDFYGLSLDTTYTISVRGYCDNKMWSGWSDWSDTIAYTPPQPGGIPVASEGLFTLSPNPAGNTLSIISANGLQGTATVLDLQGRLLASIPLTGATTTLDISTLPAATYIVEVAVTDGSTHRQKFIKQ